MWSWATERDIFITAAHIPGILNVEADHKSFQKRSYFWSVFSCIRTEYRDLRNKFPYSVRIQENTDQK